MKKLALTLALIAMIAGCDMPTYRVRLFSGDKAVGEWHTRSYGSDGGLTVFTDLATGQRIAVGGNIIIDQYDRVITPEKP